MSALSTMSILSPSGRPNTALRADNALRGGIRPPMSPQRGGDPATSRRVTKKEQSSVFRVVKCHSPNNKKDTLSVSPLHGLRPFRYVLDKGNFCCLGGGRFWGGGGGWGGGWFFSRGGFLGEDWAGGGSAQSIPC